MNHLLLNRLLQVRKLSERRFCRSIFPFSGLVRDLGVLNTAHGWKGLFHLVCLGLAIVRFGLTLGHFRSRCLLIRTTLFGNQVLNCVRRIDHLQTCLVLRRLNLNVICLKRAEAVWFWVHLVIESVWIVSFVFFGSGFEIAVIMWLVLFVCGLCMRCILGCFGFCLVLLHEIRGTIHRDVFAVRFDWGHVITHTVALCCPRKSCLHHWKGSNILLSCGWPAPDIEVWGKVRWLVAFLLTQFLDIVFFLLRRRVDDKAAFAYLQLIHGLSEYVLCKVTTVNCLRLQVHFGGCIKQLGALWLLLGPLICVLVASSYFWIGKSLGRCHVYLGSFEYHFVRCFGHSYHRRPAFLFLDFLVYWTYLLLHEFVGCVQAVCHDSLRLLGLC